jgi:hypothetical protein
VGQLILEIHDLTAQVNAISSAWGDAIEEGLDEEQADRLARIRRLAELLPAFKQVGLIPPPPPRAKPEEE